MKVDEVKVVVGEMDGLFWVVKVQIYVGGCGKGYFKEVVVGEKGGVCLVKLVLEVEELICQMLGCMLVIYQMGEVGKQVNCIYIEDGSDIVCELYLVLLVDCQILCVLFVVLIEGGMDIEEVVVYMFEKIVSFSVDLVLGLLDFYGCWVVFVLGLIGGQVK